MHLDHSSLPNLPSFWVLHVFVILRGLILIFISLLQRFNDIHVPIRLECVKFASHCLMNHPDLAKDLTGELAKMLFHLSRCVIGNPLVMSGELPCPCASMGFHNTLRALNDNLFFFNKCVIFVS